MQRFTREILWGVVCAVVCFLVVVLVGYATAAPRAKATLCDRCHYAVVLSVFGGPPTFVTAQAHKDEIEGFVRFVEKAVGGVVPQGGGTVKPLPKPPIDDRGMLKLLVDVANGVENRDPIPRIIVFVVEGGTCTCNERG